MYSNIPDESQLIMQCDVVGCTIWKLNETQYVVNVKRNKLQTKDYIILNGFLMKDKNFVS